MKAPFALAAIVVACLLLGVSYKSASGGPEHPGEQKRDHSGGAHEENRQFGFRLFTDWIPVNQRRELYSLEIALRDHNGKPRILAELLDEPTVLTFFYSRCQNARKCSTTLSHLAFLQRQLVQAGMDDKVRLLAITYEPQFDTPERINRFATDRGLRLGEHALTIQLDYKRQQQLIDELEVPVNYNAGWVNTHGVEMNLLDAKGRLVRKYTTLLWDNNQVIQDLKRVIAER